MEGRCDSPYSSMCKKCFRPMPVIQLDSYYCRALHAKEQEKK